MGLLRQLLGPVQHEVHSVGLCGSPYARRDFVDSTLTDQSSVLRFIEDNWRLRRLGNGSTDATTGSLDAMFDFERPGKNLFVAPGQLVAWDPTTSMSTGCTSGTRSRPFEELISALNDQVRAGKVLYLGISDTPAWIVARAVTLAQPHGLELFCALPWLVISPGSRLRG